MNKKLTGGRNVNDRNNKNNNNFPTHDIFVFKLLFNFCETKYLGFKAHARAKK